MKGYNRLEQIMDYLKSHNLVTVDQLVAVTDASPATIRRDLIKLDQEGVIIGGRIDDSSQSCIGDHGRRLLQNIWPDLAFVSCNGWDLEKGVTSPTEEKAALKRDLIANARRRILLADSSKYGAWSLFNITHLDSLTDIITDSHLPEATREALTHIHPRLIVAG